MGAERFRNGTVMLHRIYIVTKAVSNALVHPGRHKKVIY